MYTTDDYEDTHSYNSVISYNGLYYCYEKKLNQDQVIDQIIMIDEVIGEIIIENISNGRYCVYE